MLVFEPFSLSALQRALPYIQNNPSPCCDNSAGCLFMWNNGADVRFSVWNDTCVIRQTVGEQTAFSYPFGADPDGMLDELILYARANHLPLRFYAVDDDTLGRMRADHRLQPLMCACDRRWSDYIYDFEEAGTFKGRKFSGQRNHMNKFRKLCGEPEIRFLTDADRNDAEELFREYAAEHPPVNAIEKEELEQARKLYDVYPSLGLFAAGLFTGGKLAALSIGEIQADMLIIHVEKALARYEGIYPTIYSGFVRLVGEHCGLPLRLVNREDDAGDPGLRTSKQQYHPIALVSKYLVHVHSPASGADPETVIARGGVVLTAIRESDKREYMELNTDVENNRYWGYDYREDTGITGPVDENTFYDSVTYDMRAGDSVNFAVRTAENGPMIGEAIIWNFTSDGSAEVGCRIAREYQGSGYGTAAFGAAAGFASKTLNLKVTARCYKQNAPSFRMITANGFTQSGEDETYYYFEYKRTR